MEFINKDNLISKIKSRISKYKRKYEELTKYEISEAATSIDQRIRELEEILFIIDTTTDMDTSILLDGNDFSNMVQDFCYEYDDRKEKWYELCPQDRKIISNPTWENFAMNLAKKFFNLGQKYKTQSF